MTNKEEFEKWATLHCFDVAKYPNGHYKSVPTVYLLAGWEEQQKKIDALEAHNAEIELQSQLVIHGLIDENDALKEKRRLFEADNAILRAEIDTLKAAPTGREVATTGWQFVPTELTEVMNVAGTFAASQMRDARGLDRLVEKPRAIYRAQLRAAPTPPAEQHYEEQPDGTITPVAPTDIGIGAIAPPAPEVDPVAWIDEFGNVFPLAAWNGKPKSYLDQGYKNWRPLYTHPADDGLRKAAKEFCGHFDGEPRDVDMDEFFEFVNKFLRRFRAELDKGKS